MGVSGEVELLSPGPVLSPVREEANETGMVVLPQSEMDPGGTVRKVGTAHCLPRLSASGGLLRRQDELRDKTVRQIGMGRGKRFSPPPGRWMGPEMLSKVVDEKR
jgi:hypothetical protein